MYRFSRVYHDVSLNFESPSEKSESPGIAWATYKRYSSSLYKLSDWEFELFWLFEWNFDEFIKIIFKKNQNPIRKKSNLKIYQNKIKEPNDTYCEFILESFKSFHLVKIEKVHSVKNWWNDPWCEWCNT